MPFQSSLGFLTFLFSIFPSLFQIWTEFIPCIFFIVAFILLESVEPVVFARTTSSTDRYFVMQALILGLVVRPICSGLAHAFYVMSQRAFVIWWAVDYVSILLSILGYGLLMGRFTFFCMESQQVFFAISVVVLFLSTIAAVLFVASPGIRTSSFILYILFANGRACRDATLHTLSLLCCSLFSLPLPVPAGLPYIYQLVLSAGHLEEHDVPKSDETETESHEKTED